MIFGPIQERIYADKGHALDLSNKAFELLEFIGWEYATEVLPLIVEHLTQSRSEEEQGTWRAPVDLVALIHSAEDALHKNPPRTGRGTVCKTDFHTQILEKTLRRFLEPLLKQCITVFRRSKSHDIWHSRRRGAWRVSRNPTISKIGSRRYILFRFAMRFIGCWHGGKRGGTGPRTLSCGHVDLRRSFSQYPSRATAERAAIGEPADGADELRERLLSLLTSGRNGPKCHVSRSAICAWAIQRQS